MKKHFAASLLLLSVLAPVWAAPSVATVSDASATAQGDVRRPVKIDVIVENRGKEPTAEADLQVTVTPQARGRKKTPGVESIYDPYVFHQKIPALAPNQKQTISFDTPYESKNSFKGNKRNFKAGNIDPTGSDVIVDFQAVVNSAPTR